MKLLLIIFSILTLQFSLAFGSFANKTNGESVTITGKVTEVKRNSFMLKTYGKNILVEMDSYDGWAGEGFKLINGDQVVVYGRIDNDFLEKKKVEAGTVYVKNINAYFFANSADEEGYNYIPNVYSYMSDLPENVLVDIQGKITKINKRELTVDTGSRKVTVDTKKMTYNPLDKLGFTKLKIGDRVRVSGKVEDNIFESNEVAANYLTKLE